MLLSTNLFINLGLERLVGSETSENIYITLTSFLENFDISLEKDVIAIISNGCSVMMKLGQKFRGEDIIYQAHGIHLGIVKSLYCAQVNEDSYSSESCSSEEMSTELSEELPRIKMEPSYQPLITKLKKSLKVLNLAVLKKNA